jgi:signal transduction histidine kinase
VSLGLSERGLILAPHGRNAQIAAAMLGEAGIVCEVCGSIPDVVAGLQAGAGFAVVTEEALHGADLRALASWLESQPGWSDFPFILLTGRGGGLERNPAASRVQRTLGNVSFLERPFHPTTLVSVCSAALRGRRRQYAACATLLELHEGRRQLLESNATLEDRVARRSAELERTYHQMIAESRQREAAEDQLRQAQKLETLGKLTGGVAHDFNNLLTAVLGNLSLLQKHLPAGDLKPQRWIDGAIQGAKRGAALTQRLLAFARRQSLHVAPVDVVTLVAGMTELLERSIGPLVKLSLRLPPDRASALIDANQVELALLNLAVNARDAMPSGGELEIGVDRVNVGADKDLPAGQFVRIWVSDTGSGMDDETLKHAIEPFFSTKELGKGTGLGLSMIHGLAIQLNGALRLESVPGQGTRAELYLPATDHAVAVDSTAVARPDAAALRVKILLVDDDALIAMSGVDMLEDLGHEVLEANSGRAALDVLRKSGPVDLLITDFAMPQMTGVQLIEAAQAIIPGLPVLLATGYAELPNGAGARIPKIEKPYTQTELASAISKLLLSPATA